VDFRAEMDCLVAVSACPEREEGGRFGLSLRVALWIFAEVQFRGMSCASPPQPVALKPPSDERTINHIPFRYTATSVFPSPS
jgi:hypothetical protein